MLELRMGAEEKKVSRSFSSSFWLCLPDIKTCRISHLMYGVISSRDHFSFTLNNSLNLEKKFHRKIRQGENLLTETNVLTNGYTSHFSKRAQNYVTFHLCLRRVQKSESKLRCEAASPCLSTPSPTIDRRKLREQCQCAIRELFEKALQAGKGGVSSDKGWQQALNAQCPKKSAKYETMRTYLKLRSRRVHSIRNRHLPHLFKFFQVKLEKTKHTEPIFF